MMELLLLKSQRFKGQKFIQNIARVILMFICFPLLGQDLKTTSFDAEILDAVLVDAEVSSTLDSENRTHIAWISHRENASIQIERRLMYSVVDGQEVNTTEVFFDAPDAAIYSPSIILDDNENPHIVFALQRDVNVSISITGNSAVYYAGDGNGDGAFEVTQISTNPTDPEDDSDDIFDAGAPASIRPQIAINPNGEMIIGYSANYSSLTSYDEFYIFARKSGSEWDLSQEYNADDISGFNTYIDVMIFPEKLNSHYHHGWVNDNAYFMVNQSGTWEERKILDFEGDYTATFTTGMGDRMHFTWHNDTRDPEVFAHAVIEGADNVIRVDTFSTQNTPGGHHRLSAVDPTTERFVGWYSESFSSRNFLVYEKEDGTSEEIELGEIGVGFGKKVMRYRNGFISLVTASESDQKIYVTTGYLDESTDGSEPPAAPTNLSAAQPEGNVELQWDHDATGELAGYNIYRAEASFSPTSEAEQLNTDLVTSTGYTDSEVAYEQTYYYRVSAVNDEGLESELSGEVEIKVQDPNSSNNPPESQLSVLTDYETEEVVELYEFYDNYLYTAYSGYNKGELYILDISNPSQPELVKTIVYDDFEPNELLVNDGRLFIVGDPGLKIYDLASNPSDPGFLVEYESVTDPEEGEEWEFNSFIEVSGNTLFSASGYFSFMSVDITDIDDIRFLDGFTFNWFSVDNFKVVSENIGWMDDGNDLRMIDFSDPANLQWASSDDDENYIEIDGELYDFTYHNDTLYTASWTTGPIYVAMYKLSERRLIDQINVEDSATFSGTWIQYHPETKTLMAGAGNIPGFLELSVEGSEIIPVLAHETDGGELAIHDDMLFCLSPNYSEFRIYSIGKADGGTASPTAPTNLSATQSEDQVELQWDHDATGELAGYNLYRAETSFSSTSEAEQLNTDLVTATSYTDSELAYDQTYYYRVSAVNDEGLESELSGEVEILVEDPNSDAPATPEGLTATISGEAVDLSWNANTESDLAGYHVYRAETSFSSTSAANRLNNELLSETGYTDDKVLDDIRYYYRVSAVDTDGNESPLSNQVDIVLNSGSGMVLDTIAYYPLTENGLDQTENHEEMEIVNAPFQDGGIYSNGNYYYGGADSCLIESPVLTELDQENFQISVEFRVDQVPSVWAIPVFVLGSSYREFAFNLKSDQTVSLYLDNQSFVYSSDQSYSLDTWHTARIIYASNRVMVYLDDDLIIDEPYEVSWPDDDRIISNTNFSNGGTYKGLWRNVVAYDSVLQSFEITAVADPAEGGSVSGSGTYDYGQTATLTATPETGYDFEAWTEDGTEISNESSISFTVSESRDLVANFMIQSFDITASADPADGGSVSGSGTYDYGQTATLTATPETGYAFVSWTEDGTEISNEPSISFTVSESRDLVANFTIQSFDITASADPADGGSVSGSGTYDYGQTATLTATPATGYDFEAWTEDGTEISNESSISFTVSEARDLVAHFELQTFEITAVADPSEGGTVSGAGTYDYGETATLTATPETGYEFEAWNEGGTELSDESSINFTVSEDRDLVAHFSSIVLEANERNDEITLYPNPVKNQLNIRWSNFDHARITDLSGKQLLKSNTRTIDLRKLNAGVYLITIAGENEEHFTYRLVKE